MAAVNINASSSTSSVATLVDNDTSESIVDENTPLLSTASKKDTISVSVRALEDIAASPSSKNNRFEEEQERLNRKRLWRLLPALAIGSFLAAADQTIVVSSQTKIGSDLDALNKTSWLATGYVIGPLHVSDMEIEQEDPKPCNSFSHRGSPGL